MDQIRWVADGYPTAYHVRQDCRALTSRQTYTFHKATEEEMLRLHKCMVCHDESSARVPVTCPVPGHDEELLASGKCWLCEA